VDNTPPPPLVPEAHMNTTPTQPPVNDAQMDINPSVIPYDINAPADPFLWEGQFQALSIFGTKETFVQDTTNIVSSLERAAAYINQRNLKENDPNSLDIFHQFGNAAWHFLSAIYNSKWDRSLTNSNVSFRDHVSAQFNSGHKKPRTNTPANPLQINPPHAKVSKIPPPIPPRLPANIHKKALDKINKHNSAQKAKTPGPPPKKSYARAINSAPTDILKLRETFPSLPASKILEMHKAGQKNNNPTPRVQTTTKRPSRKNVLIPLEPTHKNLIYNKANEHVAALNNLFKSYKSKVRVDCFRLSLNGMSITTSEVASPSDLSIMEKYFKGLEDLSNTDISPRLPQSKSYLKILGVPYFNPYKPCVINRSFHQVLYHYSFPFLYFTFLFIAWETLSHYVT